MRSKIEILGRGEASRGGGLGGDSTAQESISVTVKVPKEIYLELQLRLPEGGLSGFVREAILEKLKKIPRPDRLLEVEGRVEKLEGALGEIRRLLIDLGGLTPGEDRADPYSLCQDEIDRAIVDLLSQRGGETTTNVARVLERNRWLVLNRLRGLEARSVRTYGRALIQFVPTQRMGKKRAWWIVK